MEEAPQMLPKEHVGVRKIIDEVFEEFAPSIKDKNISVDNSVTDNLSVKGKKSY